METRLVSLRPFHESVICIIKTATPSVLATLAELLVITRIPKDHDKIIATWKARLRKLGMREDIYAIEVRLLEQKRKANEENEVTRQATEARIMNLHLDQ